MGAINTRYVCSVHESIQSFVVENAGIYVIERPGDLPRDKHIIDTTGTAKLLKSKCVSWFRVGSLHACLCTYTSVGDEGPFIGCQILFVGKSACFVRDKKRSKRRRACIPFWIQAFGGADGKGQSNIAYIREVARSTLLDARPPSDDACLEVYCQALADRVKQGYASPKDDVFASVIQGLDSCIKLVKLYAPILSGISDVSVPGIWFACEVFGPTAKAGDSDVDHGVPMRVDFERGDDYGVPYPDHAIVWVSEEVDGGIRLIYASYGSTIFWDESSRIGRTVLKERSTSKDSLASELCTFISDIISPPGAGSELRAIERGVDRLRVALGGPSGAGATP